MAKLISTRELATIITALLVKPELLGELDSPEKHRALMEDLGRVVAEHCGGNVTEIALPETDGTAAEGALQNGQPVRYLETKESSPYLIVHPDASLPSVTQNVWMHADHDDSRDERAVPPAGLCTADAGIPYHLFRNETDFAGLATG